MNKLNEISDQMDQGFDKLSNEISAMTQEIEAFVRKTQFEVVGLIPFHIQKLPL